MVKILGAVAVIFASLGTGIILTDSIKKRITAISSLTSFIEFISMNIMLYKTPLEEIYSSVSDTYLKESGFLSNLEKGVYLAAYECGLLSGDEEKEIIKNFSDKLGSGTAEDMAKLCSFTASRLHNLEEKLHREYPDKKRVYHTVSLIAGASAVIILI